MGNRTPKQARVEVQKDVLAREIGLQLFWRSKQLGCYPEELANRALEWIEGQKEEEKTCEAS